MQIEKPSISGGRANNDVLLYKHGNSVKFPAFFLGCDSQVITDLTNHLKRFKLRSKVDIFQGADYESFLQAFKVNLCDEKNLDFVFVIGAN